MKNILATILLTLVFSFVSGQTIINIDNQNTYGQTTIISGVGQPTLNFIQTVEQQMPQYDLIIQDRNSNSVMSGWYLTVPPDYISPSNSSIQLPQELQSHNFYWIRNN